MANESFSGQPPLGDVPSSFNLGNSATANSFFSPPPQGFDPFIDIGSNRPDVAEKPLQTPLQHVPSNEGPPGRVEPDPVMPGLPQFPPFPVSVPLPSTVSSAASLFGGSSGTDDFFSSLQPQSNATPLATTGVVPDNNAHTPQEQLGSVLASSEQSSLVPQPSPSVGPVDVLQRSGFQSSEVSSGGPLSLPAGLLSSIVGEQVGSQGSPVKFSSAPSTELVSVLGESDSMRQKEVVDNLLGKQVSVNETRLDSQVGGGLMASEGICSDDSAPRSFSNASSALPSPMARQPSNAYGDVGMVPLTDPAFLCKTNADPEYSSVGARSGPKRPLSNLELDSEPTPKYLSSNLTDAEKFSNRNMSAQPIGGNPLDRNTVSTSASSGEVERASSLSSSHNQSSLCSLLDNQEDFTLRSSPIRLLAPAPFDALASQNPPSLGEVAKRPDSSNVSSVPPLALPFKVDSRKVAQAIDTTGYGPEQNHTVASGSVVGHSMEVAAGHGVAQDPPLPMSLSSSSMVRERLQDAMVSQEDPSQLPVDGIQHAIVSQSTETLGGQGGPKPLGKTPGSSRGGSERPDSLEDWEIVGDSASGGVSHLVHSSTSEHPCGQPSADLVAAGNSVMAQSMQLPSMQGRGSNNYGRPSADSSQVQLLSGSDTSTLVAVSPTLEVRGSGLLQSSSELAAYSSGTGTDQVGDQKRPETSPVIPHSNRHFLPTGPPLTGQVPSISQEVATPELNLQGGPGRSMSESVAPALDSVPPSFSNPSLLSSSNISLDHPNLWASSSDSNVNMAVPQLPGHSAIQASNSDNQPPMSGLSRQESENPGPVAEVQDHGISSGIPTRTYPPHTIQV